MASTYTSSLRVEKPGTGEQSGTWGTTVNTGLDLLEAAIAGYVSIAMADSNVTLTTANGSTDQARRAVIELTGTNTATRQCIVPAVSKVYIIKNSTTQSVTVKTSGGTGPTILTGKTAVVFCDGTNVNLVGVSETTAIGALGAVTPATDTLPYFTSSSAATVTSLTSFARTILDDADAATVRTTIGLGSLATLSTINNANWSGTALAVANGGTGSTTASAARTALGLGTLSTLNTINDSNWSGTALAVANGGTGSTTASAARTALGLAIGTNVQAFSANLTTFSGIAPSANVQSLLGAADYAAIRSQLSLVVGTNVQAFNTGLAAIASVTPGADALPYFTGASTAATTTLSAFARTLLDDADAATMRATLGVSSSGTSLQVASNLSDLNNVATARSNLGVSASGADTAYAWRSNNLSDLANAGIARTNLGVTATGADTTYAYRANNLSDLASASTARTNLGLGSLAVLSTVNDANWSGTDLAVANGGTGASTASGARTNLGLVIGTDVQAFNTGLAAIATVTPAADALPYFTGASTAAVTTLSAFARTLLDDADAATARATLGVSAAGGSLQVANNLSDVASAATSRTNLGLGTSATINTGTSGTTIPLLDGTNTWSGTNTFDNTAANVQLNVGANNSFNASVNVRNAAGFQKSLFLRTSTSARWAFTSTSDAESGSNAGSDLEIRRYDDAGVLIDVVIGVIRSTGVVNIGTSLTVGGVAVPTISSTSTFTNKTLSSPTLSGTVSGTPTISSAWTWSTAQNFPTNSQVNGSNIVTLAATQTLTNKTLTSPVISTIVNTGTLTLPTSTDTLVGRATTDTLTNKTLTSPVIATISNSGTITLPTGTRTLVARDTTDTLSNKTLTSPVISGTVNGAFTVADSLTWTSAQNFAANSQVAGSDIVSLSATQTLTNKTFTTPTINGGSSSAGVQDSSETTGSLTSASANKRVVCSGNVTLPASGMTSGQMIMIDPAGSARTITRPAAHTMYVNDVDSATATTRAHNIAMAVFHGSSKYTLHGTA